MLVNKILKQKIGCKRHKILAIRVVRNSANLGQTDTYEKII